MAVKTQTTNWTALKELVIHYHRAADRSACVRAYAASCRMLGAILEAALLLMAKFCEDRIQLNGYAPRGRGGEYQSDPEKWTLEETIHVAKELGWLPEQFPSLRGYDPITLTSSGLPEAGELLDQSKWHQELVSPSHAIHVSRAVTEDIYISCCSCLADILSSLSDFLSSDGCGNGDNRELQEQKTGLLSLFHDQRELLRHVSLPTVSYGDDDLIL